MLSLIHHDVVVHHEWITSSEFSDIIAISQMTPGPIAINSATYIGYTVAGFWGAVVSTIAVCTPALTVMVLVTRFYMMLRHNVYMERVMMALRPVIIAMIGLAAILLLAPEESSESVFVDRYSYILFVSAFAASLLRANPIMLIVFSALIGVVLYL